MQGIFIRINPRFWRKTTGQYLAVTTNRAESRKTVDNKAVYAEANVPAELIEKHTKTTAVITLKVTAR